MEKVNYVINKIDKANMHLCRKHMKKYLYNNDVHIEKKACDIIKSESYNIEVENNDSMNGESGILSEKREIFTTKIWKNICFRILKVLLAVFTVSISTVAMLVMESVFWMLQTWNNLSMEELVYHLKAPLDGTNNDMIWSYIESCVIISVIVLVVTAVILIKNRKKKRAFFTSVLIMIVISLFMLIGSISHVWKTLNISEYKNNQSASSSFVDEHYVNPSDVSLKFPNKKRNLIYIFLESMEMTYSDKESGGAFDNNVIPELTKLSLDNENFSGSSNTLNGGVSLLGSGWTVAAMFAQSSGLPLNIPIEGNSMSTQDSFLPGVTTMGDVLEAAGYNQTLLIGSDASFGGRKMLYQEHGDFEICDYGYSLANGEIPPDYRVWWGYEDEKLFENAKNKLAELAQNDAPFNLTMLTVDTHFEDGYVCELCNEEFGDNQYANVMACSSRQISEFVRWIQQQPFYENTTIVISGDHPTMDSDFCTEVSSDYQRKVYTAYINSPVEPTLDTMREYSTFDNFPTTLASLGVEIEGDKLGLGTNLFSSVQTLTERFGVETENSELAKKSELMDELTADISSDSSVDIEENVEEEATNHPATADVIVSDYDYHTGKFEISISNLSSERNVQAIRCAIWANADQSDLKWYDTMTQEDGTFIAQVWARDFQFKEAVYNIHVYVTYESGESDLISITTGTIN